MQLIYWKIQFWSCPGWGIRTLFLSPTVGYVRLFQNKMANARRIPGWGWARLEVTEP